MTTSLHRRHHELAIVSHQLDILAHSNGHQPFNDMLRATGVGALTRRAHMRVMQVNVGRMCNQVCNHCHVDAGPDRKEIMTRETMTLCLNALAKGEFEVVDVTGGAPEMNPGFRWFVEQIRRLNCHVIDRCNLTILTVAGYHDMVDFLARHRVEVTASLPCYRAEGTDAQRGEGVFDRSIDALGKLNAAGYGDPDSGLVLNLVFNPIDTDLPPDQGAIEAEYKRELMSRYGIVFNNLYTITNMPINRFLEYLIESGNFAGYMDRLIGSYNPAAAEGLMCRDTLSVGWDGQLYDCDFNQMLDLNCRYGAPKHIRDFDPSAFDSSPIITGQHCYGCTAGTGSSCGGAVA